LWSPRPP